MKIGLVIDDHMGRPGGVQQYVRGLYHYLRRHGYEAVIFAGGGGTAEERVVALGRSVPFRGSGSSTSIPMTFETPHALRALLRRERCDVLHVMAPYAPTLSGRLLVQSASAHVMTLLVALEPAWWADLLGIFARFQWRSLRRYDARIAISMVAAATGRILYGGQYELVPCGVDLDAFQTHIVPLPEWRDEHVNLVYVGRLEARKGVAHLLRAYALLRSQYSNLRLLIGGDGPERCALEQLAAHLELKNIHFLGYVPADRLPRLLASGDIFCAPATHAESFGIILVEAMAAGLPIVAAGNRGYRELLSAHEGNLVVRPADHRGFAGALAALIEAPALRQRIGQRNQNGAQRYSWECVGQQIVALYERVLAARRGHIHEG